ncbi:MAG: hypothetical protein EBV19_11335 [Flavobacteriia bacterium]|nr:hypothetical protein [Flavobacteriia bacterium]
MYGSAFINTKNKFRVIVTIPNIEVCVRTIDTTLYIPLTNPSIDIRILEFANIEFTRTSDSALLLRANLYAAVSRVINIKLLEIIETSQLEKMLANVLPARIVLSGIPLNIFSSLSGDHGR